MIYCQKPQRIGKMAARMIIWEIQAQANTAVRFAEILLEVGLKFPPVTGGATRESRSKVLGV